MTPAAPEFNTSEAADTAAPPHPGPPSATPALATPALAAPALAALLAVLLGLPVLLAVAWLWRRHKHR